MTLTLDAERLQEMRALVGGWRLSAAIDRALGAHLVRLRHLRAVNQWLAELDHQHGPGDPEILEWADGAVGAWDEQRSRAADRPGAGRHVG